MLQSKIHICINPQEYDDQTITIGRRETYGTHQVIFDCADVFKAFGGPDSFSRVDLMYCLPNGETRSIPLNMDRNNELLWNVSTEDTERKGNAECELYFYLKKGGLWKSNVFLVKIKPDIGR